MKPLLPQSQALIDAALKAGRPPLNTLCATEARVQFKETRKPLLPPAQEVAQVRDARLPGPLGEIPVRMYRAMGSRVDQALPVLVYFHGGGWVVGDLDTHDVLCRQLANSARCAVISVDYRMGPEDKFPAAVEDALAVTEYVAANARALGCDATRIAVGGDSAGGNLAAVVALTQRDRVKVALRYQLLIYPATDMSFSTNSYRELGQGYLLTHELMLWFRDHYLGSAQDVADWRASPLKAADLSRLPPAYVATASHDPLLDEGAAYADKLRAAGVAVTYKCYDGMLHGFATQGGVVTPAVAAVDEMAAALAQSLHA